jgi:hypothetical protein
MKRNEKPKNGGGENKWRNGAMPAAAGSANRNEKPSKKSVRKDLKISVSAENLQRRRKPSASKAAAVSQSMAAAKRRRNGWRLSAAKWRVRRRNGGVVESGIVENGVM